MNSSIKVPEILRTGVGNARNVSKYVFGDGTLNKLEGLLEDKKSSEDQYVIYYVDEYFTHNSKIVSKLPISSNDELVFVSTHTEPTTDYIDNLVDDLLKSNKNNPDKAARYLFKI